MAAFGFASADAQATSATATIADNPAGDAQPSPYDVEHITATTDTDDGTLKIAVRFAAPLPVTPPESSAVTLVLSRHATYQRCNWTDDGDVKYLLTRRTSDAYGAFWSLKGRDGSSPSTVTLSEDRREATIEHASASFRGPAWWCLGASSTSGGVVDAVPTAHFPGHEPRPPVLLSPADGTVVRGIVPSLVWDAPPPATQDDLAFFDADPAYGAAQSATPTLSGETTVTDGRSTFAPRGTLPPGRWWWRVRRHFGDDVQTAVGVFTVGPPTLTVVTVKPTVRHPKRGRHGEALIDVAGTSGAQAVLSIRRDTKILATRRIVLGQDQTVDERILLSCLKPGLYTATVVATDDYGTRRIAAATWRVRRRDCRRTTSRRR